MINAKTVTYDFERVMPRSTKLKCSELGDTIIKHMGPGAAHADNRPAPQMQRA